MNKYIGTFFSHFGAIRFHRLCQERGWKAEIRPVPRDLSSSCGTCVFFETEALGEIDTLVTPELEQLVCCDEGYKIVFKVED